MAATFYKDLFTSEGRVWAERITTHIEVAVTNNMNERLTARLTDEEIEVALFEMGPTRTPGPDGLTALFYQKHCLLIKDDVCRAVRDFVEGRAAPETFNDTVIVMIPK